MPAVVAAEAAYKERRLLSDAQRHMHSVQQPESIAHPRRVASAAPG